MSNSKACLGIARCVCDKCDPPFGDEYRTTPARYLADPTYTQDQRMKDMLLCEDIVWLAQRAVATSLYVDAYCEQHPDHSALHYSADYDLYSVSDLAADSSYTFA